jgi:hypothetical protein
MPKDESALLRSLFDGIAGDDRSRLVDLLNVDREDSGARLTPRRWGERAGVDWEDGTGLDLRDW